MAEARLTLERADVESACCSCERAREEGRCGEEVKEERARRLQEREEQRQREECGEKRMGGRWKRGSGSRRMRSCG
eukprot:51569-Rhodomonas_salina.5